MFQPSQSSSSSSSSSPNKAPRSFDGARPASSPESPASATVGVDWSHKKDHSPNANANSDANKVFVSSHFQLDARELEAFLARKRIGYADKGDKLAIKYCRTCRPHKNRADNLWKLFLWKQSGNTYCHRCGTKGSYYDFQQRYSDGAPSITTLGGHGHSADAGKPTSHTHTHTHTYTQTHQQTEFTNVFGRSFLKKNEK